MSSQFRRKNFWTGKVRGRAKLTREDSENKDFGHASPTTVQVCRAKIVFSAVESGQNFQIRTLK
jgi:hypothetical protein